LTHYGARYYSPELSVWYGVDPLMEKYPQNGAYVFCNANPVRFVDVDGRATYSYEDENGNVQCQWFDSEKLYYADENGNTWKLHSPEPMLSQKNNTTEPSYDQKYGQPVIGGMGEDSKTTSEFTGPSIDGGPKYIDQYKTIKGLIDKFFGRKYDVEKHNVEPKEPKVREYRRPIVNHRVIYMGSEKSFGIRNQRVESDTVGIEINVYGEDGNKYKTDTIPY